MRILIVTTYFPPLNSIASLRPYSWAKAWSQEGHDVTVLTTSKPPPSAIDLSLPMAGFHLRAVALPQYVLKLKRAYGSAELEQFSHFTKRSLVKKFGRSLLKRALLPFFHFLRHKKGVFNTCRMPDFADVWIRPALKEIQGEHPWDLVISTAGPYATHVVASRIKKRQQAKLWVADYRDAWSDSRIYPGLFPFNRFESWWERRLMQKADCITTVSVPFAEAYASRFPQIKAIAIENGFDTDDMMNLSSDFIFPLDGKFRLVYTGTVYEGKQDPRPLFQAMASLKNSENSSLLNQLEVLFAGPNQHYLQKLIKEYGLEHWITLAGTVSREDALRMQRDAHGLLFLAWNDATSDGIMTGKLFEYLYSKTPILSINNRGIEAAQKLILEANAGVIYTHAAEIAAWLRCRLIKSAKNNTEIDPCLLHRYRRDVLAMKLLDSVTMHCKEALL